MSADQITDLNSLPGWLTGFWAIGVWGGLAGSILLLMRSRHAVWAFALSFVGAIVGMGYQMFAVTMPASMKQGMMGMIPWVIIGIAAFLLWYAWSAEKRDVLR
jgi:fatty acid desaturase